jgi:hypothetical protein
MGVAALALALALAAPAARGADRDLDRLAAAMCGSFSSAAQAARDTSFFDIRLHIVPIWPERSDARWLYVEQATAERLERPYRQRIYRLRRFPDRRFESAVYTLPGPARFAGAWSDPARFAVLTPDSLSEREGCAVVLRKRGGRWVGGTEGRGCASDLRGAAYATSEAVIDRRGMRTLDRGWHEDGTQAWGSLNGPYEFVKEPRP